MSVPFGIVHTISVNDEGELVFEDGRRVSVYAGPGAAYIRVGCHRVMWDAWEVIKRKIEGEQ